MKIFARKNIKYIVLFVLTFLAFAVMLFPTSGDALGFISEFLNITVGWVFSLFPFSVMTVFILLVPVFAGLFVWRIVVNARRRSMKRFWTRVVCVLCAVFVWYTFVLGINYRKTSVYDKLGYAQAEYTLENLEKTSEYLIGEFNKSAMYVDFDGENRALVLPDGYDAEKITQEALAAIEKQNFDFLYDFTVTPKYTFVPGILNALGFDGVYFPLFAELNIDSAVSAGNLCVLLTHELMHAKGVLNEAQAEYLAQYICVNSDDPIMRYCGCYTAVTKILTVIRDIDENAYRAQLQNITDEYLRARVGYFTSLPETTGVITSVANFFYDIYLKLNFMSGISVYDESVYGWVGFGASV